MSGNGSLRQRVRDQANGGTPGAEVARASSLRQQIERMAPEYQMAMPKGMEATQLVRDAITCLRKIDHLDACEPGSVLGALMTCAQLGLRPAVLGHAWPLPYWDNKDRCYKAQLVIGYQGYVELGYRSGRISAITSRIVRQGERFTIVYHEDRDELTHEPAVDGLPGEIRSFYSTARLVNGGYTVTEPWSVARMEAHRDKHAPRNREQNTVGPWRDNFPEMGQKTMVLVNYKLLPKSAEMAIAMEADGGIRLDLSPVANAADVTQHPVIPGHAEPAGGPADSGPAREEVRLRETAGHAEPKIASGQIGYIGAAGKRLGFEAHEAEEFVNCIAILAGAPGLKDIAHLTQVQGQQVQERLGKIASRTDLMKLTSTGEITSPDGE